MGLVSWLIILPFLTAMAVLMVPAKNWKAIRWISLTGTGMHLMLTAFTTMKFWALASQDIPAMKTATMTKLYFVERVTWFQTLGIDYFVGLDGISMSMVILTSIIIFAGTLASWNVEERTKEFFVLLLTLVTGVFGVFMSFDLFLFFMFYEVAVLPMYLLIGIWGTGPKEYAAMKLTLMLMVGSALILVGMLAVYHASGLHTFDLIRLATVNYPASLQTWVFPMFFLGFGVLGALYPFHTWSPDGHASAPTAVSMLHAGVLMKLGGYGALRIAVYLLPEGAKEWGLFFMGLTTINIVYGSFGAIMQKDLKYFTAYSSVSHCGFVLFGVAAMNLMGFKGAIIQMFSHGIMTGLFFALIGMVYGRTHTRIIPDMGGLAKVMPWLAVCFYVGGMASLGLPGFAGFVAESHVFMGGFFGNNFMNPVAMKTLTIIATVSIVVTAVYVLRGLATVFQGPITNHHFHELTDATLTEKLSTGLLVATLAVVGFMPWYFIDLIEASIFPFVNRLQASGTMVAFH
ncbi:MAG: NADH dehydrogenase [Bdellovibrionales bacterium GWB1_52_6]|nr:MAG: NADH dehydrogenase [Bdellovibrionales bacterium GWB1_52_6]OFZ05812.1 MAG: NADH dehydrogenase [Bdellovibrionales bacterium GWA1_52_35]HCM40245.1 NADH-quinone oxidoreductase subunit M [Bdellovibrionales bacterium]